MSGQFYAINESGIKVSRDSNESLGVIPMITVSYLSFEDMSWNDMARVSRRVSRSNGCYIPRLGEGKSFKLTDGTNVKAKLVNLMIDNYPGFTFQITDGLKKCQFSDSMGRDLYERLPDDLKEAIVTTVRGDTWIPTVNNILGPDSKEWYDWYEYHNTPDDRRITDDTGEFSGYWVTDTYFSNGDDRITAINDRGYPVSCDPSDTCVPSICFSLG